MTIVAARSTGLLTLVLLTAPACSVPPEQTIVSDFFAASRLRDRTALSKFATVVFEPREQGTVTEFTIEGVSAERRVGDLRVKDVTILAPVRSPGGAIVRKFLVVTLQRPASDANLSPATTGPPIRPLYGGWMVTGVTDAPASRASPRS